MEQITVEQVLNAKGEEYERLKKTLNRRAALNVGGFIAIKIAIFWFIHQSAKKYWSAS